MKRRLVSLIKLAFTLLLLALLYSRVDRTVLSDRLRAIRWEWVGIFLVILLVNSALSALKWKVLLAVDGIHQSFQSLLCSYLIGSFFNVFLPSTIGGDAYRIADIGKRSARTANTAASVMADRLSGFLALALYALLFPLVARRYIEDSRLLLLPVVAFAGLLAVAFVLWEQALLHRMARLLPGKIHAKVEKVLDALLGSIRAYGRSRNVMLSIIGISFLFQFLAITAVYCLGRAIGLELPWLPYGFFVPFISLMEMIPISVFGIGLRDTGYVWFMQSVGKTTADAAALSVLYVAATVAYVSFGGLLYMGRALRRGVPVSAPPSKS